MTERIGFRFDHLPLALQALRWLEHLAETCSLRAPLSSFRRRALCPNMRGSRMHPSGGALLRSGVTADRTGEDLSTHGTSELDTAILDAPHRLQWGRGAVGAYTVFGQGLTDPLFRPMAAAVTLVLVLTTAGGVVSRRARLAR